MNFWRTLRPGNGIISKIGLSARKSKTDMNKNERIEGMELELFPSMAKMYHIVKDRK